jgi:hypothetical protein
MKKLVNVLTIGKGGMLCSRETTLDVRMGYRW